MTRRDLLIVGQGLAGTVLGATLERAGIPFEIVDAGHRDAASRVAAGIINPVTGRRIVRSWAIEEALPVARALYKDLEKQLGCALWRDLRVQRRFKDEAERRIFEDRRARGELGEFGGDSDASGGWIEHAAQVDLQTLLRLARERWLAASVLREEEVAIVAESTRRELVIDCAGQGGLEAFAFVPWEFSKGEIITVGVAGLDAGVILNDGHWVLPLGDGTARVGATHEPGTTDCTPTAVAREQLQASARRLLGREVTIDGHDAGVRVNLPDRRPVAGRHPQAPRLGILNGLGAKGAHMAPWLAQQWVNHLTEGVPFRAEIDVRRFWR